MTSSLCLWHSRRVTRSFHTQARTTVVQGNHLRYFVYCQFDGMRGGGGGGVAVVRTETS